MADGTAEEEVLNHLNEKSLLDQVHNSITVLAQHPARLGALPSPEQGRPVPCSLAHCSRGYRLWTHVGNKLKRMLFFFLNILGKGTSILAL